MWSISPNAIWSGNKFVLPSFKYLGRKHITVTINSFYSASLRRPGWKDNLYVFPFLNAFTMRTTIGMVTAATMNSTMYLR